MVTASAAVGGGSDAGSADDWPIPDAPLADPLGDLAADLPASPEAFIAATPVVAVPRDARCGICREEMADDIVATPRRARYVCLACHGFVCSGHQWIMLGVCRACASDADVRALQGGGGSQSFKELLGIKWVE